MRVMLQLQTKELGDFGLVYNDQAKYEIELDVMPNVGDYITLEDSPLAKGYAEFEVIDRHFDVSHDGNVIYEVGIIRTE